MENLDQRRDAWVVLTSLVNHDGAVNTAARDRIVMSVFNIERETTISTYKSTISDPQNTRGSLSTVSPPLYLNIHLMFMANFAEKSYTDGLAALSRLISFFQQTPCFHTGNSPGLDPSIGKMTLDLESMAAVDVNYVMGMMGARYMPSVFYKLRVIPFASSAMLSRSQAVTGAGLAGGAIA